MKYINRNSELNNNDFDGVIELQDLTGQSPLINNNPIEPYEYAGGRIRRKVASTVKKAGSSIKQTGSNIAQRRQERRTGRIDAKKTQARASLEAAKSMGKSDPSLAAALSQPAPTETKSNTGLYIGLGVAGVAVLGIVVFLVMKKKK